MSQDHCSKHQLPIASYTKSPFRIAYHTAKTIQHKNEILVSYVAVASIVESIVHYGTVTICGELGLVRTCGFGIAGEGLASATICGTN